MGTKPSARRTSGRDEPVYTRPLSPTISIETPRALIDHLTVATASARADEIPEAALRVLDADPDIELARIWLLDVAGDTLTDVRRPEVQISVTNTDEGQTALGDSPLVGERFAHVPISLRGHVLGVLSFVSDNARRLLPRIGPVATLLAQELVGSNRYSDILGRYRREEQLSVSATVQRTLLPLLNYRDESVEVVGRLEPAYDVAGDVYDYAVNPEGVHLAILDAVGHDLRSTTLSSLALGAYRRGRRAGATLADIASEMDEAVRSFDDRFDFVTGLLALLHVQEGRLHLFNAGHHPPYLVRGDTVTPLGPTRRSRAFGLDIDLDCEETFDLDPDDLLAFYTDGVIEARNSKRTQWGVSRLEDALRRGPSTGLDTLAKSILDSVVSYVGDRLSDDAALLLVRPARLSDVP